MRLQIGSLDIVIGRKASVPFTTWPTYPSTGFIRESFAGAWQRGITVPVSDALQNPTYFACTTLIASDISKCCFELLEEDKNGIYEEVVAPAGVAFLPVLRQPNHYQNQQQFIEQWVLSKLCYGNTLVLKGRDARGVVDANYIIDWNRCRTLVTPSGQVYYALSTDQLAAEALDALRPLTPQNDRGEASVVVPAREVIHDRWNCFYHPLVGLGPVYAAGALTSQGQQIIANASRLAQKGFRTGGIITSAEPISEENAAKLNKYFTDNFGGADNADRIMVLGGGLKYEKPPTMTSVEADIIKQLNWDDERICSVFHMPSWKVLGPAPGNVDFAATTLQYYAQCLQVLVTAIETCWGEGIAATEAGYEVGFDEDDLMRMDPVTRMKVATEGVKGGIFSPNRGRVMFNEKPLKGGDTIFLQEQDHSLDWIVRRDAMEIAPKPAPAHPGPPQPEPKPAQPVKSVEAAEAHGRILQLMETADV